MEFGKQRGGLVAGWKQHPVVEPMVRGNPQQERRLRLEIAGGPRQRSLHVSGDGGQLYVWRGCHPNRHAVTAQTPGDRKTVQVSANDQCSKFLAHRQNSTAFQIAGLRLILETRPRCAKLSKLGDKLVPNVNSIDCGFPRDAAEQFARRVMCANNKLHQRPETPDGGRSKNVQPGHRRFKSIGQSRVTAEREYGLCEVWREEFVFGYVYFVSGSKEHLIECSRAPIIQPHFYFSAGRNGGNYRMAKMHGHFLKALDQPSCASRPD